MLRIICIMLVILMFSGCSGKEPINEKPTVADQATQAKITDDLYRTNQIAKLKEGLEMFLSSVDVSAPVDDKLTIGSSEVDSKDYQELIYNFKIKNKSNNDVNFSIYGWNAELNGKNINSNMKLISSGIMNKSLSKSESDGQIKVYIKKSESKNDVTLTYKLMNYEDPAWDKMLSDAYSGKYVDFTEYEKKFKPVVFRFKI